MSLWEFGQAMEGYAEAHGGEAKPSAPTDDRHAELLAKYA
jgi:hypothetical protein